MCFVIVDFIFQLSPVILQLLMQIVTIVQSKTTMDIISKSTTPVKMTLRSLDLQCRHVQKLGLIPNLLHASVSCCFLKKFLCICLLCFVYFRTLNDYYYFLKISTAVSCPDDDVANGEQVSGSRPPHRYNAIVTFKCLSGYVMEGVAMQVCGLDSKWSPGLPKCKCKLLCIILFIIITLISGNAIAITLVTLSITFKL